MRRSYRIWGNLRTYAVCPEFCKIVFLQPGKILNWFQTKHSCSPAPKASPLVSLVYELKTGVHQHLHGCMRITTIKKQARAALSQPLVIKGRNRVKPPHALVQCFGAKGSERFITLDHNLWL